MHTSQVEGSHGPHCGCGQHDVLYHLVSSHVVSSLHLINPPNTCRGGLQGRCRSEAEVERRVGVDLDWDRNTTEMEVGGDWAGRDVQTGVGNFLPRSPDMLTD